MTKIVYIDHIVGAVLMAALVLANPATASASTAASGRAPYTGQAAIIKDKFTSPTPGQMFAPGDTVRVAVAPIAGTDIKSVIFSGSDDKRTLDTAAIDQAPFTWQFSIPQTTVGHLRIVATVFNSDRSISTIHSDNDVQTKATIMFIHVTSTIIEGGPQRSSKPVLKFGGVGENDQLHVTAAFSDGVQRDVTSYQTQYASANPAVATISDTGFVTAVARGVTYVTISSGGLISTVPVIVKPNIPYIFSVEPSEAVRGDTVKVHLSGGYFGGTTLIQFLTHAGVPDPNIAVAELKADGPCDITATVSISPNCPVEADSVVVTAAGGSSNPRVDADSAEFDVVKSGRSRRRR